MNLSAAPSVPLNPSRKTPLAPPALAANHGQDRSFLLKRARVWLPSLTWLWLCVSGLTVSAAPPAVEPEVAAASPEAEQALSGFKIPRDWKGEVFAAEPLVANPVAFHIDRRGRVYVCESFRQERGIEDNRKHPDWLESDQAAQTVDDRLAYLKKFLGDKVREYEKHDDRIRLLIDRDGDGKADHATVFANGFNEVVSGTGAGIVTRGDDVFFTCIPDLWRLRDENGDGVSDRREAMQTGYGVRFAFRGHDLHGLVVGPDGKLYFSVGDRGYNVVVNGQRWANPESGAVFRCLPDGSQFEVVAYGLRNPQELAFDDDGNLFTCDNNSDSGDQARWTVIAEGGDTGWRMSYQYLPDRGPFNREKIWHPYHPDSPAHLVPPITNLSSGPSGLAFYPGTGLSDHYQGRFFLCDFRGAAAGSVVRTFKVESVGAFYRVVEAEETLRNILATDVEFGPDGAVYVSDWVNGWSGLGKGRIYRFTSPEQAQSAVVAEVRKLLAEGFDSRSVDELTGLIGHVDRRVRQGAQFALARQQAAAPLAQAAGASSASLKARLHALWGLGQIASPSTNSPTDSHATARSVALAAFDAALTDSQAEIRAQAAKLAGDARHSAAIPQLIAALQDENSRVQFFAAQSLGKLSAAAAIEPLVELLARNQDADPLLRHAASTALARIAGWKLCTPADGSPAMRTPAEAAALEQLIAAGKHPSPSARTGVVVALRKLGDPRVADFLNDADPRPALEAARAIYDERIDAAAPRLAELVRRPQLPDPVARRALHANFRLGTASNAVAVAQYAARTDAPLERRLDALKLLEQWASPPTRDGVLNHYRPLARRDPSVAKAAVQASLTQLLARQDAAATAAIKLAATLGLTEISPILQGLVTNANESAASRADALRALVAVAPPAAEKLVESYLEDSPPVLRATARELLARRDVRRAIPLLAQSLSSDSRDERQLAARVLASLDDAAAVQPLSEVLQQVLDNRYPADSRLDVVEAARTRPAPSLADLLSKLDKSRAKDDPLSPFANALEGGSAAAGRAIFFERTQVSCVRCHKIEGQGGDVGPDLTRISPEKTRSYLLEAIVVPNRAIAKNFETALVVTDDGKVVSGIVKEENAEMLRLMTAEGRLVSIPKASIEERREGKSAMPEDLVKQLTPRDVRDLVEFLYGRRSP